MNKNLRRAVIEKKFFRDKIFGIESFEKMIFGETCFRKMHGSLFAQNLDLIGQKLAFVESSELDITQKQIFRKNHFENSILRLVNFKASYESEF